MSRDDSGNGTVKTDHHASSPDTGNPGGYFDSLILRAQNKLPVLAVRPVSVFENEGFTDDADADYEEEYRDAENADTPLYASREEKSTLPLKNIQVEQQGQSHLSLSNIMQKDGFPQARAESMGRTAKVSETSPSIVQKHAAEEVIASPLGEHTAFPGQHSGISKVNALLKQSVKRDDRDDFQGEPAKMIGPRLNGIPFVDHNFAQKQEKLAEKVESIEKNIGLLQFSRDTKFRHYSHNGNGMAHNGMAYNNSINEKSKTGNDAQFTNQSTIPIEKKKPTLSASPSNQNRLSSPQIPIQTRPIAQTRAAEKMHAANRVETSSISVSIGHVEIKAVKPPAAPVKSSVRPIAQAQMSLEKYLASGSGDSE